MNLSDRALLEWEDSFRYRLASGRKGGLKITITGSRTHNQPCVPLKEQGPVAARNRINGVCKKTPEVIVKVSGGGRGMGRIRAHFDYISRNGGVALEDEQGRLIVGRDAVRDLGREWKYGFYGTPEESNRKEAFNIVLSMPPGTDRESVTAAARTFADKEFSRNQQYVFASHEDEQHPHVHLCVKALGIDGTRLNPRKADLQRWRERFAEALREHGVDANASPRRIRGQLRRTVRQSARHSNTTQPHADNAELPICPCTRAIKGYAVLAIALARGDEIDRSLAINVTRVVSQMMSEDKANQPQLAKVKKTVEKRGLSQCVKGPSSASALDR